jgi:hypothetical protein
MTDVDLMRFQEGIGWPHPRRPRGLGRGEYRMSRAAYQARVRNLAAWRRSRSYEQTRRIEIEIALATHRGESFRAIAKRLGLRSFAYCWRVARRYRAGLLRMLPLAEPELVAFRDSLYGDPVPTGPVKPSQSAPIGSYDPNAHGWNCECSSCRAKAIIEGALARARKKEQY